jgi:hypothetical protein
MAMLFPQKGIDAIRALYKASPQDEPARKRDIQLVGEQMCFDLGNRWGNKKRSGTDDSFRSADSIAYLEEDNSVSVWDIQSSSGVILVSAGSPPTYPNIPPSEAAFMPCVPINHMGGDGGEPEPIPPDINAKLDLIIKKQDEIIASQSLIFGVLEQQQDSLGALNSKMDEALSLLHSGSGSGKFPIKYPNYVGRVLGISNVVLTPIPQENP